AVVNCHTVFFLPETADQFDFQQYDYIIDAVDTVTAKIELVMQAEKAGCPIISSMGAGNKLHPELFEIADIYKTSVCPLAKVMRKELRARGIKNLKVVYSKEIPIVPLESDEDSGKRQTPGSTSFVPSVAGLIMAGAVIRDLVEGY
ncbi:MAG: tRNA threonylcarbamoyladenosine dehydratase, partial [Lachnospiraceae bacterium]|nr:tRNA threonylcarbamoyladenosine dehydratase [Lachnospiraceae bacterium]